MTGKEKLKKRDALIRWRKLDAVRVYVYDNNIGLTDEEILTFRSIINKMQDCYMKQMMEEKPE